MRVAFYFTDTQIGVIKLAGKKPIIVKVPLEKGIIEDGLVKDVEKGKKLLLDLSKKLNLKNSEIILGISEKYIFSKTITVTDGGSDLEVKINEELESYVPGGSQAYSDWQIIEKTNEEETITLASVATSLVDSYLSLFQGVALPIIGITPIAFALARHIPKNFPVKTDVAPTKNVKTKVKVEKVLENPNGAILLINLEANEAVLTIANEKGGILLTSVLPMTVTGQETELLDEIGQMRMFYDQKNQTKRIIRAFLTGEGTSENLKKQISTNLGITVDFLQIQGSFLSPQDALSFFPLFAVLDLPIVFPKNHTAINLLPQNALLLHDEVRKAAYGRRLMTITTGVFVLLAAIYISLFAFLFWNQYALNKEISKEKDILTAGKSSQLRVDTTTLNKHIAIVKKLKERKDISSHLFSFLSDKVPGGIVVTHYKIDLSQNTVILNGTSLNRDVLLGLKQALEDEEFTQITIPLTSLEKKGATNFAVTFSAKPTQ